MIASYADLPTTCKTIANERYFRRFYFCLTIFSVTENILNVALENVEELEVGEKDPSWFHLANMKSYVMN